MEKKRHNVKTGALQWDSTEGFLLASPEKNEQNNQLIKLLQKNFQQLHLSSGKLRFVVSLITALSLNTVPSVLLQGSKEEFPL